MGKDQSSAMFLCSIGAYGNFSMWPEFSADVGRPVAPPHAQDGGLWLREYTKSLVVVNPKPTASASTVLSAKWRYSDLDGSRVAAGELRLAPVSARVLLRRSHDD